ncbi:hypothetical protein [Glutamicibacter sp. PS]|uniref:hypothetical protein n=1 Tax=Glutamicibacter sp. PS TaxID=3075634 RepID=UPI00284BF696|nr:hypothetical protein [Glutamicibacter sp. PS]MDR4534859.1 hypothetical protein [Glutamicibacter sp. PS]
MTNPLSAQLGSFAVAALIIYVILRGLATGRNTDRLELARRHAFWCAAIGFFASTSANSLDALQNIPLHESQPLGMSEAVGVATTPALWVAFLYLAGQFTWPRKLAPQRTASLEPRTLSGLIPKPLVAVMLSTFATGLVALYSVRDVPGLAPRPEITEGDGENYSIVHSARPGLRDSAELLPYLFLSLVALVVVALIATLVILRRKPLEGITEHDNRLLRITWLNRLYRTVTVLLATTAAQALHYKARYLYDRSTEFLNGLDGGIEYMDRLESVAGRWDETANYAVLAICLVMLLWRPPTNFEARRQQAISPFGRLREQLFAVQYMSATLALLVAAAFWQMLPSTGPASMPTAERTTAILFLITAVAFLYLLINAAYLLYMMIQTRTLGHLPRPSAPLPRWTYISAGTAVVVTLYFLLNPPLDSLWGFVTPVWWIPLVLVSALLAAHAGFCALIRATKIPWNVTAEQEIWYRQVLEFRSLRVVTGAIVSMLLLGYQLLNDFGLVGVVICFAPAVLALQRPAAPKMQRSSSVGVR